MDVELLLKFGELQKQVHKNAVDKGFWALTHPADLILPTKLALVHSEVSEALEALREGKPVEAFEEELADIIIRVMDIAEFMGIDLIEAIDLKMEKNQNRPYKHGKEF